MFNRKTNNVSAAAAAPHCPAIIERLESRQLLSASPNLGAAALAACRGVVVNGTDGADNIVISMAATPADDPLPKPMVEVRVNDATVGSYTLKQVKRGMVVFAGDGDDTVSVDDEVNGVVPVRVGLVGGAGNDVLFGGSKHDVLVGGAGDDQLFGNDGNDWLYGDAGADFLGGGTGDDRLHGGGDDDSLDAGDGDDRLDGGAGFDSLTAGAGADRFANNSTAGEIVDLTDEDRGPRTMA